MWEATFGYRDLKILEYEVSSYECDLHQPCAAALKMTLYLLEKWDTDTLETRTYVSLNSQLLYNVILIVSNVVREWFWGKYFFCTIGIYTY